MGHVHHSKQLGIAYYTPHMQGARMLVEASDLLDGSRASVQHGHGSSG